MATKLFQGAKEFKKEDFETHKSLFSELKKGQNPHTFFIGCSDSRVVPNVITKALPGDLFVVRNIANVIPPYKISGEEAYKCTASALEYAVEYLEVRNIVVCGHSNCGGLKALFYNENKLNKLPIVKKWLGLLDDVKKSVEYIEDAAFREWEIEHLNILKQIDNLTTYPFVEKKFKEGKLNIFGWYYIIETGEVYNYNFDTQEFELIN